MTAVDYFNNNNMAVKKNDERRWRAEMDAETMAQYEEIMADSTRRNAAIRAAQKRIDDLSKRVSAMNRVVNKPKTPKK